VLDALRDVTSRQPSLQLPELFGGYARESAMPPLSYAEACRPQAWAAAGLIHLSLAVATLSASERR